MSSRSPNPTVIWSGNGYHIHIPVELDTAFEDMWDFQVFSEPSVKFLRWAARRLTNGKADHNNNPSFRSMLLRVPGTINSKAKDAGRDPIVRFVKIWRSGSDYSGTRYRPSTRMINDFHAYLVQEAIEMEKMKKKNNCFYYHSDYSPSTASTNTTIGWIEKLLQTPLADDRKYVVDLILAPYLIVDRRLDEQAAYSVIIEWLDKCNQIRPLDFDPRDRTIQKIKQAKRIQIPHMSWSRLQERHPKFLEKTIK